MVCWCSSPSALKVGVWLACKLWFNVLYCIADSPGVQSFQVQQENATIRFTVEPPRTASPFIIYSLKVRSDSDVILAINFTNTTVDIPVTVGIANCVACERCNASVTPFTSLGKGLTTSQPLVSQSPSKLVVCTLCILHGMKNS